MHAVSVAAVKPGSSNIGLLSDSDRISAPLSIGLLRVFKELNSLRFAQYQILNPPFYFQYHNLLISLALVNCVDTGHGLRCSSEARGPRSRIPRSTTTSFLPIHAALLIDYLVPQRSPPSLHTP
jgi:hypothetical protein